MIVTFCNIARLDKGRNFRPTFTPRQHITRCWKSLSSRSCVDSALQKIFLRKYFFEKKLAGENLYFFLYFPYKMTPNKIVHVWTKVIQPGDVTIILKTIKLFDCNTEVFDWLIDVHGHYISKVLKSVCKQIMKPL